ncbi:MAG: hypothetical protein IJU75_03830, partial [Clostridia bacterium]|nr:hypothetical protein [Clostridia bacterium]
MRKHKGLSLLSLILAVMLCIPTLISATVLADGDEIVPDAVFETEAAGAKLSRSDIYGFFGDSLASSASGY